MAKNVGSIFFLEDRRLSASFKKGGFDALSAEAGAESATSRRLSSLYWLTVIGSNLRDLVTPELILQLNALKEYLGLESFNC